MNVIFTLSEFLNIGKMAYISKIRRRSFLSITAYEKGIFVCRRNTSRYNELGIQMLSPSLHDQIFKVSSKALSRQKLEDIKQHLMTHKLYNKPTTQHEDISFQLPQLEGSTLDEHFRSIANRINRPYVEFAETLLNSTPPKRPKSWLRRPGWTRYDPISGKTTAVDFPTCKELVFDIEVLVPEGNFPTMATALSPRYWYSWASPRIFDQRHYQKTKLELCDLINLDKGKCWFTSMCHTASF